MIEFLRTKLTIIHIKRASLDDALYIIHENKNFHENMQQVLCIGTLFVNKVKI